MITKLINRTKNILAKKFIQDVSLVYAGSFLNGISLFLINIILGRSLEKEWFAIFSLSILTISTVAEMSDFGLNGGLLRFAPFYIKSNQIDKLKQLIKTIWQWRVLLSAVLTLGGIILSWPIAKYIFNQPQISGYLAFSFLGVGGIILLGFISAYLQAKQDFFRNAIVQTLKGVARLIIIIILLAFGINNIYALLSVYILIPWILFIANYNALPKEFYKIAIEKNVKRELHSQLAKFSFWLTIWSLSAILASRIDQIMLSNMLGLKEVAIYAIAFQFVYLYALASQAITSVLMPKISGLATKDDLVSFSKRALKWILPAAILLSVIIYPSQYIITLIFDNKYADSIPVYLILSYSMVFGLFNIPLSLVITAFNRTKLIAFSGFIQLLINVFLNFILIPRFGVLGAGITFSFGIIVSFLYNLISSIYLIKKADIKIV